MNKTTAKDFQRNARQLPQSMTEQEDSMQLMNLTSVLEKKLSPKQLRVIVEIGLAIGSVGLSLDDACLRSRLPREELDNLILYVPEIKTYLHLKQIEYKYKLLNVVTTQAVEHGDVKMAMWLLEKQYSSEYDSSVKKDLAKMNRDADGDIVEMAFAFVRRQSMNKMPVNPEAGKAELPAGIKSYDLKDVLA